MKSSFCNVIFMPMISPSVKNTPLGLERFYVPFPFCQRERESRPSLNARGLLPPRLLLTLQLSASVSWRWERDFVSRMALLVPPGPPASSWRSDQWRQILQLLREGYRKVSSSDVQLLFWVFQYPITALISFDHIWT